MGGMSRQELLDHCKAARDATQRALRCAMEHLEQSGCRGPEQGKMEGEEATGKDVKEGLQGEEEGPGACLQEGAASGRQDERQQQDTVEDWGEEEEFSIPEIGLSSASLAAINGLPAAEGMQGGALLASPALLDDKTSTLELYDQVILTPATSILSCSHRPPLYMPAPCSCIVCNRLKRNGDKYCCSLLVVLRRTAILTRSGALRF